MTNPFENEDGDFVVLVNQLNQHSLWPTFATQPAGWLIKFGPETRRACLSFVEEHWTDLSRGKLAGAVSAQNSSPRTAESGSGSSGKSEQDLSSK